jgi:hypothetical protein
MTAESSEQHQPHEHGDVLTGFPTRCVWQRIDQDLSYLPTCLQLAPKSMLQRVKVIFPNIWDFFAYNFKILSNTMSFFFVPLIWHFF